MKCDSTIEEGYVQAAEYNREDELVLGCDWSWVAGLISEDDTYRGMDWSRG